MSLYVIVEFITVSVFVVTACVAISVTKQSKNYLPEYLKYFYWYPIIGVIDGIALLTTWHLSLFKREAALLIDNYSLLFHFVFLSGVISSGIIKIGVLRYLNIARILFVCIIFSLLIFFDSTGFNGIAYGITNTGLFVICLIYFFQLLKKEHKSELIKDPFFWIVNGVFLGMGITIPIHLTGNFFKHSISKDIYFIITAISPFAYFLMYLFFIKAYRVAFKNFKTLHLQHLAG